MNKQIIFYEFYVMDWGWEAFPTVPEMISRLTHGEDIIEDSDSKRYKSLELNLSMASDFISFCRKVEEIFPETKMTSGFCTDIHVMPLVDFHSASFALAWKGGRGGWCIIATPHPIPWIEKSENCNDIKIFNIN